jgi:sugar/nucleoside kinase (ribokinase family)
MKYDFITIGGAVEDITFRTDDGVVVDNKKDVLRQKLLAFEYGAKIGVKNLERFPGGGANNAGVCLSRLGFKVGIITTIGDDEAGQRLIENFKKQKVDIRFVKKIKDEETGFSFVVKGKNNEHVAFVYRGAAGDLALEGAEVKELEKAKWLYVSSLSGKWENVLNKIFAGKNIKMAWNPGIVQLKAGASKLGKYLKKTEILFVNKDEAIELAVSDKKYKNKGAQFIKKDKELILALKSFGSKIVIMTDGINGANYFDGQTFYHEDSLRLPDSKIADTTGIGDTFCSTVLGGLEMYQGDFKKAMKLGMKNAAENLKKPGAQAGLIKC